MKGTPIAVDFAICLSLLLLAAPSASAQVPGIVDTHGHVDRGQRRTDFRGSLDAALHRADQSGIRRIIIMPPLRSILEPENLMDKFR